jgi:hypothetical protein
MRKVRWYSLDWKFEFNYLYFFLSVVSYYMRKMYTVQWVSHRILRLESVKVLWTKGVNKILHYMKKLKLKQGWPTSGPKRYFWSPNSNRESVIFRYFGCISSLVFCYYAAQIIYIFGQFFKWRPIDIHLVT